ncbi:MAG: YerC/YecD family TrpR-related protein [Olsenella sp.]|jgi:TrpR-related protein YerC/YecD|nr:YerC/YecD family TrpR-related protein [Olsenella sp.]MCI1289286.1 YerC/YecD family TrpR-related protein [Olsenella sp.]
MDEGQQQRLRAEEQRLFSAFGTIRDADEARAFLLDVCSPKEIADLAQRLQVATLLADGASYVSVSRQTGASSTTVSRVSKCLNGPAGGYRLVLGRIGTQGGANGTSASGAGTGAADPAAE